MGEIISLHLREGFIPGKTYNFDPPVVATGIPLGGSTLVGAQELCFAEGWCISFKKEKGAYLFQGNPVNDPRKIKDDLRGCYFFVEDKKGSRAVIVNE